MALKEVVGELKEHRRLREQAIQGEWYAASFLERIVEATEGIAQEMGQRGNTGSELDWVGGQWRVEEEGEEEGEEEDDRGVAPEVGGSGMMVEEKEELAEKDKEKAME